MMLKIFLFIPIFSNFLYTAYCYAFFMEPNKPLPGNPSPPGSPWPLPQIYEPSTQVAKIGKRNDFKYLTNSINCEPLLWAQNKFSYDFLFGPNFQVSSMDLPVLNEVHIIIESETDNECDKFPRFSKESSYESYFLSVEAKEDSDAVLAIITSKTVWGAIRGVETFTQLIYDNEVEVEEADGSISYKNEYFINMTKIIDWPRFPHRGLMLDTARHYYPESTIITILDGMFYSKFNVFHWHIVDDQSFPFVSKKFPKLSLKGAFSRSLVYTPDSVQRIINEARMRGIRVIFEFDTPGHTKSIGRSYPELLTQCYGDGVTPGTPNYPEHSGFQNLDPTQESTYKFLKELFTEILKKVSKDEFIHLGLDEVNKSCWSSSLNISNFMKNNDLSHVSQVEEYFAMKHIKMVEKLGGRAIVWQDPIEANVKIPSNVIIQVWKNWYPGWKHTMKTAIKKGHQVILSAPWYLSALTNEQAWKDYYEIDPVHDIPDLNQTEAELIIGGEACLWSEFLDSTNILARTFPFASAVGEKLWSRANSSTVEDAMWRLDEHRCRLLRRGIPAQPIIPGFCR